ncbi:amino acid adenylation domain-containing protein [Fontibacillus panacisegetis]|uniref:Amino acid adenylation domain-containing protein n=1 Tax=Fontibacillus panacisegetis TaxID=670482 RepID=A0A1G7QQY6_9BACL|nr:non-ribosomal peptide synthetase [Fontibacillus panacisegetis]SDG00874.1 amino acid adenylation domain-containing protein [Fontibacillus panacisegetis]
MRLTEEQIDKGRRYWLNQLSGEVSRTVLPVQYPKSAAYEQAVYRLEVPRHLSSQMVHISKGKKLALYVVLLAAFQAWLGKINGGQSDIAVTIPVLPLSSEDVFERQIVVRNQLRYEASFREMLEQVKQTITEGYKHQFVGISEIIEDLGLQKEEELRTPLAIAMSGLHEEADIRLLSEGRHEAVVVADSFPEGINLNFYYNARLFAPEAMEIYARSYIFSLEQFLGTPDMRLNDALLLPQEEGQRLIAAFNDTNAAYSSELTIPELIEKQALLAPGNVAVCSEGIEITYAELNEKANRLAGLLMSQGIGPGSYVAVLLDRSVQMIIGVLGTLKAGAAYVPIEPGFPKARVETILRSLPIRSIVTKTSIMRSFQELIWKIDTLQDIVYMDIATARPPAEVVDVRMVGALWDKVAEESVDRVTAGGFISSYSGLPFSEAEVDEYRDRVVELARPYLNSQSNVLEIGCGSGLIAFSIAPMVNRFVGLDPSKVVLEMNRVRSAELQLGHTEWLEGYALQLEGMEASSFDLILMASTVQFFPGYFYFEQVVREAMRCLKPGGVLIIADVMDLRQKESFQDSLIQYRKQNSMATYARGVSDQELYCDEDFFADLQGRISTIGHTEVLHRKKGFENELRFRYDVVLRKELDVGKGENDESLDEKDRLVRGRKRSWTQAHIDRCSTSNPRTSLTSEDEAYIIFTSGTTGTPKGVVIRHRPVINLIEWVNRTFGVGAKDRLLFITSLCFDLSVYDIFGTLASGGSIRIASEDELSDRERLLQILCEEGITFWDSAPAALQQLATLLEIDSDGAIPNPDLRLVFMSGDWIPLTLPGVLEKHFPNVQVVALGGATEATVWSNFYPIRKVEEQWVSIPYGTPIQNARYYILDAELQPCPPYVPGNLYIGGECLASGYTDARLTEERFIRDPYREREAADARMYKTGDLARWMPDGVIEFLGRSDHQVKIRGYRIELGDIQAQLLKHPRVLEALVTDWMDSNGSKAICAYYTSSSELSLVELKEYLGGLLPVYMIPSYFVALPLMPITSNGKINRSALPGPQDHIRNTSHEAPSNLQEATLARIWGEVLGLERVGVTEDFYSLGGDSLKAVQVVAKANDYQFVISLKDMLHYRTIREIIQCGGMRIKDEAAAGIAITEEVESKCSSEDAPVMASTARKYNLQFDANIEEMPYYYPCVMGAMYTKIRYETGYPIPRGFLPVGGGLGLIVFSVPQSDKLEDRLQIDDIRDIPGFDLLSRLGIEGKPQSFGSVEEGLAWCEERMSQGQAVIGVGTTYYLNYSHDYMVDEDQYASQLMEIELGIQPPDEPGFFHSHMFLMVDHTHLGYTVYDSTYNFYGTISEVELKRSFAGVANLKFLQRYPIKYATSQKVAFDVSFEQFQAIPLQQLALELLEQHIDFYTSTEPLEDPAEGKWIYTGLASFQPFRKLIEDAFLEQDFHKELYLFVIFWIRKWKYTYIFFRDFLIDTWSLLELPSLKMLIENVEESIQYLGGVFDRLQDSVNRMNELPSAEMYTHFQMVLDGLESLGAKQRKVLNSLQNELISFRKRRGLE